MTDSAPIPVALCFDVEPDEFEVAMEARPWLGFERLVERSKGLRADLEAATGRPANFSWFVRMDPQITLSHGDPGWVADRYGDRLAALRAAGDTIGLHPHAWRWSSDRGRWIADHGDPEWVEHCLSVSFETYRRTMGETCQSMRMGDRFVDARTIQYAVALGLRYDLSLEPGSPAVRSMHTGIGATGRIPSQEHVPIEPYRADVDDPLRRVNGGSSGRPQLWMIPLTAVNSSALVPAWRRVGRRIKQPLGPSHRLAPLAARWNPAQFWQVLETHLDASPRPHLAFAVRSDTAILAERNEPFEAKLAALMAAPLVRRLAFLTPDALVAAVDR